jgi:hypothetical protein
MLHENYKSSPQFGRLYSADKFMLLSRQKMGWATFWANFSQTHLVTDHSSSTPNNPVNNVQRSSRKVKGTFEDSSSSQVGPVKLVM